MYGRRLQLISYVDFEQYQLALWATAAVYIDCHVWREWMFEIYNTLCRFRWNYAQKFLNIYDSVRLCSDRKGRPFSGVRSDRKYIIEAVCINCNKRFSSMHAVSMHLKATAAPPFFQAPDSMVFRLYVGLEIPFQSTEWLPLAVYGIMISTSGIFFWSPGFV